MAKAISSVCNRALWGETIKSPNDMEYMLLPRLLGFAERAWAKDPDWATRTRYHKKPECCTSRPGQTF